MAPKRKRLASSGSKVLGTGQKLKRSQSAGHDWAAWGWVGTQVVDASNITQGHRITACGLCPSNKWLLCPNKYSVRARSLSATKQPDSGSHEPNAAMEDVIVISDSETRSSAPACTKALCRRNPFCLNHLGQEKWQDEEKARRAFMKAADLGFDPNEQTREADMPVGLQNLGATCYANALLQVWFQDHAFRDGVYRCLPLSDDRIAAEDAPIFQLQVTFAAMQRSTMNVFNPVQLVKSLELRAGEQQDAQEFSKLFMSHLEGEFQKQSDPSVQSLIANQFRGRQAYGTLCKACGHRSEHESNFLELEVNLQNNSTLQDRFTAMLESETLTGDNRYHCSHCDQLRDAERYVELRHLPPVLHLSLLRFVYDVSCDERKKSKHSLSFPTILDMNPFVKVNSDAENDRSNNIYHLRGILLHKGASAYHGHYEAQIFDGREWYQFDDETVTKLKSLGTSRLSAKSSSTIINVDDSSKPAKSASRLQGRKKQRVADSDDEILEIDHLSVTSKGGRIKWITSKDAYMLVYTRQGPDLNKEHKASADPQSAETPAQDSTSAGCNGQLQPPQLAQAAVDKLNQEHLMACKVYNQRQAEAEQRFQDVRNRIMGIYGTWNVTRTDQNFRVASEQGLQRWLCKPLTQPARSSNETEQPKKSEECTTGSSDTIVIAGDDTKTEGRSDYCLQDILCEHGHLTPRKCAQMKCITQAAYEEIKRDVGDAEIAQHPDDICAECVREEFDDRLFQYEHPKDVDIFDEECGSELDGPEYWISKQALKAWRQANTQADCQAALNALNNGVQCSHGDLATNAATRQLIPEKAREFFELRSPSWHPIPSTAGICSICEVESYESGLNKRELRKQAEDEKVRLVELYSSGFFGVVTPVEHMTYAIVPSQWVKTWRSWINSFCPRPDTLDNTRFICQHDQLSLDPNSPKDMAVDATLVTMQDWGTLQELYSATPLITVALGVKEKSGRFLHDLPVCQDCRKERYSNWDGCKLTVRILRGQHTPSKDDVGDTSAPVNFAPAPNGSRKSKRLRQPKAVNAEIRKFDVTAQTSIKDLKVAIQDRLRIPTIAQRLFLRGVELEDNSATIESLGLLTIDIVDLREEGEDVNAFDSDGEGSTRKKRRDEGRGFGGTLLGSSPPPSSLTAVEQPSEHTPPDDSTKQQQQPGPEPDDSVLAQELAEEPLLSCPTCTYLNQADAESCAMCSGPF